MQRTYVTGEASSTPTVSRISERDYSLKIEGVEIIGDREFLERIADLIYSEFEAEARRAPHSNVHPHFRGLLSSICPTGDAA